MQLLADHSDHIQIPSLDNSQYRVSQKFPTTFTETVYLTHAFSKRFIENAWYFNSDFIHTNKISSIFDEFLRESALNSFNENKYIPFLVILLRSINATVWLNNQVMRISTVSIGDSYS